MKDYEQIISTPEDRLQQLVFDLNGIQLATATLTKYNRVAFDALAPFEDSDLSEVKTAIEREKQIKGWARKKKQDLINALNPILRAVTKCGFLTPLFLCRIYV